MADLDSELFSKEEIIDFDYANSVRRDITDAVLRNGAEKASEEELTIALKAVNDISTNRLNRAKVRIAKTIQENGNREAEIMSMLLLETMKSKLGHNDIKVVGDSNIGSMPDELTMDKSEFVEGELSSGYTELVPEDLSED